MARGRRHPTATERAYSFATAHPLGPDLGNVVEDRIRSWLAKADPIVFTLVAGLAGFSAYFSMYAFRKPFTAATFEAVPGWHFALDYKIALVIAQAAG